MQLFCVLKLHLFLVICGSWAPASSIIQAADSKCVPVHLSLSPCRLGSYFGTIADSSSLLNGAMKVWTIFIDYLYKYQIGLNGVILPPILLHSSWKSMPRLCGAGCWLNKDIKISPTCYKQLIRKGSTLPCWDQSGGSSWPRGRRPFSRQERNARRWPPWGKCSGGLWVPSWLTKTNVHLLSAAKEDKGSPHCYIGTSIFCPYSLRKFYVWSSRSR